MSHNRSFINQLATHIWDVTGAAAPEWGKDSVGGLVEWEGSLDSYLYHLKQTGHRD